MLQSLFIMLREGLEAALIVGIVLAYLGKTDNRHRFGSIWLGTAAAIGVSLVAAGALFALVGGLVGPAEEIYEGAAMLTAVGVLTYMIFWMRQQALDIRVHLQALQKLREPYRTPLRESCGYYSTGGGFGQTELHHLSPRACYGRAKLTP